MAKRSNPIATFFDYTWKYIWPALIEIGIIGLGFLFVYFELHYKLAGFAIALVIQGVVNVLTAVAGFVIIVVLGILFYVICFGMIYVFPAISVLFAFGMAYYLRKTDGVELPVMEWILWALLDMILPIVYLVLYYIYVPI